MSHGIPVSDPLMNERVQYRGHIMNLLLTILAALIVVAVGLTLGVMLIQNQAIGRQNQLLIECTTPPAARTPPNKNPSPNDCYVRSNSRTGEILSDIQSISIAAASCGADHPGDVVATRKCVEKSLKR